MIINYYGHSYFKLQGEYSIALDPFGDIGLPIKKVSANYVFSSHGHYDHNNFSAVTGAKIITSIGGNFQIINSYHDEVFGKKRGSNNVLKFKIDNKIAVFMGDIGFVDENVVNFSKNCDVLFIPVGGVYTVDSKQAKQYVDKINPKIVIPMHYKMQGCNVDVANIEEFTNLFTNVKWVNGPYEITNEDSGIIVIR